MSENSNFEKLIDTVLEDRYLLLELIGEGGMAIVYRALDKRLDRFVAVKVLRPELSRDEEFVERFVSESHAVAMLSHPNIVGVFDVSHSEKIEFIVMELINGITLRQYLDKKGKVSWKEVLHFAKQISSGISHAHQRGIIHRDIKPQNIMLLQDGTIKVADFGIAALENEFNDMSGTAIGSLNYISPEQARGLGPDARSDIYSLGILMYELICGVKPYVAHSPAEVLLHSSEPAKPITDYSPDVPEGLCNIIKKAMSADCESRYQSAAELSQSLDEFTIEFLKSEGKYKEPEQKVKIRPEVNLSAKEYIKSLRRSNRVSFGIGTFALMASCCLVFAFLWNFWMKDIFSTAERISLPDFTGQYYEDISDNPEYISTFNFKVENVVNTSVPSGTVLSQNPDAGRSLMITPDGIDVELKVSTGFILTEVPELTGLDFREATLRLQNAGFLVEINNTTSNTVEKDLVISTSPVAGEKITAGSTVYIDVSSGTQIDYVKMPNLIGLTEDQAISKIQARELCHGNTIYTQSDYEAGTVIGQSTVAFAELEEHSSVTITVSTGPAVEEDDPFAEVHPE